MNCADKCSPFCIQFLEKDLDGCLLNSPSAQTASQEVGQPPVTATAQQTNILFGLVLKICYFHSPENLTNELHL